MDDLAIYDGGSMTSPMIGEYSMFSTPPDIISMSNEILINFLTNPFGPAFTDIGFKLMYNPTSNPH